MSRTYHHGNKAKERRFGTPYRLTWPQEDAPPKKPRTHNRWQWMSTPMWWIHEMMERPHRMKTRLLLASVKDGSEDIILPSVRKPHRYFW